MNPLKARFFESSTRRATIRHKIQGYGENPNCDSMVALFFMEQRIVLARHNSRVDHCKHCSNGDHWYSDAGGLTATIVMMIKTYRIICSPPLASNYISCIHLYHLSIPNSATVMLIFHHDYRLVNSLSLYQYLMPSKLHLLFTTMLPLFTFAIIRKVDPKYTMHHHFH